MMLMLLQLTVACLLLLVVLVAGEVSGYLPGGAKNCPLILVGWCAAAVPVFAECLLRRLRARKSV
jgi:hypothetical protein